jgi:hippurate hydrolase
MTKTLRIAAVVLLAVAPAALRAQGAASPAAAVLAPLPALYPELEKLYVDLHQNPELSFHEEKTSAKLADRLRALGYDVAAGVGRTGVVAVMKNGAGPAVLVRADMDALPVEEKTGVPYASKATTTDDDGKTVPVMHACGHDVHMTSLIGAATLLAKGKDRWRGTLLLVGQPAEEGGGGAGAMIKDGFLQRFGKPDFAIALHDSASLPAGQIGVTSGYALANSDHVTITVHGRGGHGSAPQSTIDPIVIAARTVVSLQTIVARETNPQDPAVVTVGSIHGGTRNNVIPDDVKLELTVRSYKPEVREHLLAAIARIAKAEAAAANAPQEPTVVVAGGGYSATYNDPALARRLSAAFAAAFGAERVVATPAIMGAEDFGDFGRAASCPSVIFWVGGVPKARWEEAKGDPRRLPSLHSSLWAPDREPTLKAGASALAVGALELLGKPGR